MDSKIQVNIKKVEINIDSENSTRNSLCKNPLSFQNNSHLLGVNKRLNSQEPSSRPLKSSTNNSNYTSNNLGVTNISDIRNCGIQKKNRSDISLGNLYSKSSPSSSSQFSQLSHPLSLPLKFPLVSNFNPFSVLNPRLLPKLEAVEFEFEPMDLLDLLIRIVMLLCKLFVSLKDFGVEERKIFGREEKLIDFSLGFSFCFGELSM